MVVVGVLLTWDDEITWELVEVELPVFIVWAEVLCVVVGNCEDWYVTVICVWVWPWTCGCWGWSWGCTWTGVGFGVWTGGWIWVWVVWDWVWTVCDWTDAWV